MALSLPPKDSPIREHFDIAHLAEMVTARKFVTYAEAKASAKALIKLITFGPKLGKKVLWNFGKVH